MTWESVVEHLAFGRNAPKPGPCLGMYLSPEAVYIAQSRLEKSGKLVVEQLVRIPVPTAQQKTAGPSATLNTGFLTENTQLATLIRDSMSRIPWNAKRVMVTLSHQIGLLRYFTMPAIDRRFWKSAVPLEAKKHIPIPFEVLSHDYLCVPLSPDAEKHPRQGALIAVTQKQNLSGIRTMFSSLGLALAGIEVAPCSVLKLEHALRPGAGSATAPLCHVHFEEGMARILIADKGLPVFFREVFLGEDSGMIDHRKLDLAGCLNYVRKSLMVDGIDTVVVSGSSAQLDAWKEAFAQETGLAVRPQETAALLGIKDSDWGALCAIGASLRFQLADEANLDLGAIDRISEDEATTARDILAAAGALTALLLILGLFKMGLYHFQAQAFRDIPHNAEMETLLRGNPPAMVDEMFAKMRAQIVSTQDICGNGKVPLVSLIHDIIDSLPENTWLTALAIHRPLQRALAGASSASLQLSGHATAQDIAHEQDLAFQFRDRLAQSPVLGRAWADLKMTISHEPAAQEAGAALNTDSFAQQERRTQFTLDGRAKARQP